MMRQRAILDIRLERPMVMGMIVVMMMLVPMVVVMPAHRAASSQFS